MDQRGLNDDKPKEQTAKEQPQTVKVKMFRAHHAEAQAELAELQLHYARQGTLLQEVSKAAATERAVAAEEASVLKSELNETRKREFAAIASAASSATSAAISASALQRHHESEKSKASIHEQQLRALNTQLHLQRNATATAAVSSIELQARLKSLQESSFERIAAAELRANQAEQSLLDSSSKLLVANRKKGFFIAFHLLLSI